MTRYDVKSILESNTLPIGGGAAKRLKEAQAIESSRKRDEMIALGSAFQYGNPPPTPLQAAYPLMHQQYEQQQTVVPLLTLQQNSELSHFSQEAQFHQSYLQTQLQLNQQQSVVGNNQFYNMSNYVQNNPGFLHGFMGMGAGSSSSVMDNGTNNNNNNGSSSGGSYNGGYLGNSISLSGNGGGSSTVEELGLVKVDYDMPTGSYGGWSGDSSGQGSNPSLFSMWNE